jgi:Fur family peroxide stress response transcriptional regulator
MGTVYRNLGVLADQGLIARIDFGSTFDRFDANTTHHYHFICDDCGTIFDLELPIDPSLDQRLNRASAHKARWHDIQFRGTCEKCLSKRK